MLPHSSLQYAAYLVQPATWHNSKKKVSYSFCCANSPHSVLQCGATQAVSGLLQSLWQAAMVTASSIKVYVCMYVCFCKFRFARSFSAAPSGRVACVGQLLCWVVAYFEEIFTFLITKLPQWAARHTLYYDNLCPPHTHSSQTPAGQRERLSTPCMLAKF